jgi:hypothetical protein
VLGIKGSGNCIRQVAVIYCCSTSVAKSLKLLTLPHPFLKQSIE